MAIQPTQPKQDNGLGKLLTVGGAIAGGVATGGTLTGIGAGAGLGQIAGGLTQQSPTYSVESQGMARRAQTFQTDPVRAITEAQAAMYGLPPDQFPEVRKAFDQALVLAQRNQQIERGY